MSAEQWKELDPRKCYRDQPSFYPDQQLPNLRSSFGPLGPEDELPPGTSDDGCSYGIGKQYRKLYDRIQDRAMYTWALLDPSEAPSSETHNQETTESGRIPKSAALH